MSKFKYYSVDEKPNLLLAKGMLNIKEYGILYSLGKSYRSKGLILDLGSFCGASAFCLGLGIQDSGVESHFNKPLHCFDLFINDNQHMNSFINKYFYSNLDVRSKELIPGNFQIKNFRDIFDFQTSYINKYIKVHTGSILDINKWEFDNEIVNVDLGKSETLNQKIIKIFYPRVIPQGYIFQQDILIPNHWYLLYSMYLLRDCLTLAFYQKGTGWLFQVNQEISAPKAEECIKYLSNINEESILKSYKNCLFWLPQELHIVVNNCFAFCMIEKIGLGKFKNINKLLNHFNVSIESSYATKIKLLCIKNNLIPC